MLQKLVRAQQSQQQLLTLQGSSLLSGLRQFSAAAPEKTKNRGLGSSRAEGTAPRFYKYVGVEPAAGQVCLHAHRLRGKSVLGYCCDSIDFRATVTDRWMANHVK